MLLAACALLFLARAFGATADTGTISGRIVNPATGEYVRNAEIAIRGTALTALTALSADDGTYRLTGVPAGEALVTVNYTGYAPVAVPVTVGVGRDSTTIDVGGSVRLTNRFMLLISGRNIRSEPVITMQKNGNNPAVAQTIEVTGTIWTFGIKGVW